MIFSELPLTCKNCGQYVFEPDGTFICTGAHSSNYTGLCAHTATYLKTKHVCTMSNKPSNVAGFDLTKESITTGKSVCIDKNKTLKNDFEQEYQRLIEPIKELIEMSDSFPHPCYFPNSTSKDWFAKINEEVFEAHEAIFFGDKNKIAEEVTDIITVCTSFLEYLGISKNERMAVQRSVNIKNHNRGYWREGK